MKRASRKGLFTAREHLYRHQKAPELLIIVDNLEWESGGVNAKGAHRWVEILVTFLIL